MRYERASIIADDLVICCKRGAEEDLASMRQIMQRST
jgi:hypothetical protein